MILLNVTEKLLPLHIPIAPFIASRVIDDEPDNIGALYVVSEARSTGIGKRLLDKAKENRDWITVWAYEKNVDALRFYKREGLVEVCREIETGSNLMNIEHRWVRPD